MTSVKNAGQWLVGAVRTAVRRLRGASAISEDIAQEAALRLLTASDKTEIQAPIAFATRTLRNLQIDQARRFKRTGGAALAFEDIDEVSEPWAAPDQETTFLLKQVILGLPPIYRDVFILNRFVGLTYDQIAERFGITTKAVEYRMSRALALCQAALRDD